MRAFLARLLLRFGSNVMPSITHAQFDSLIGANGESVRPSVRRSANISLSRSLTSLGSLAALGHRFLIRQHRSLALSICAQRKKVEMRGSEGTRRLGTPLPRAFSIKPAKYPSATPNPIDPGGRAGGYTLKFHGKHPRAPY